ncbi:hypothetical protein [Leucobacter komagatae]|nr:hypothetical protein [Leucobacter komagatae]
MVGFRAHGALVLAFRRSSGEIYGLDDMTVPRITPLTALGE